MSNIKPGRDEMPILTLADRRAQAQPMDRDQLPPKFGGADGAYLCVQTLREHLDSLTMRLDRGWDRPGHPFKPMQRRKLDIQADAVATCIELITRGGNFSRERGEALARLRPITHGLPE